MSSYRVRKDEWTNQCELFGEYGVDSVMTGRWRIYNAVYEYSSTSGGMERRGTAVRRYDSDAGGKEGCLATFETKEQAVAYHDRWLKRESK